MPPTAVSQLLTTLPDVDFFQLCGPTEGGPTGIYSTPDEVRERPDATGRWPLTYTEVRLVDVDGNEVPHGDTGEILLRSETVMKRYWNQPEATAETLRDGWLHTGDLAIRDEQGYITIVDRLK
ncbi:MAG: AMP-binding protein, partial [Nocardioidaceae bacterium]